MEYYFSKKNLETFTKSDIDILVKYYNINKNINHNDLLWQLSIIILENSKISQMAPNKVFEKYGAQLFEKAKTDLSAADKDQAFIKDKFIQMDPDKGKNVEWMVLSYINNGISLLEDLGRVKDAIEKYNWLIEKDLIDKNDRRTLVDFGGIVGYTNKKGKFKLGLEPFLENYKTQLISFGEPEKGIVLESDRIIHYKDNDFILIEALTEAASCKYGAQTRWCTASKNNNMFNNYHSQGPLYIIIPKNPYPSSEKYQIHFPSKQFMDDSDTPISLGFLITKFPALSSIFKKEIHEHYLPLLKRNPQIFNEIFEEEITFQKIKDHLNKIIQGIDINFETLQNDDFTLFNDIVRIDTHLLEDLLDTEKLKNKQFSLQESKILYKKLGESTPYLVYLLIKNNNIFPNKTMPIKILRLMIRNNFSSVMKLLQQDKINIDKVDDKGMTILVNISNIDNLLEIIKYKKKPIKKKDLMNLSLYSESDYLKLEQYYTSDELTKINEKYLNYLGQGIINHPKIQIDKLMPKVYCLVSDKQSKPSFIEKVLNMDNYPKWTVENNPIILFANVYLYKEGGKRCHFYEDDITVVLNNKNAVPFLSSLNEKEIQDILTLFEKQDMKHAGKVVQDKYNSIK
jgi:hypothetical protein